MTILVGLDSIMKDGEKPRTDRIQRNKIPSFKLRDGDKARFRFITDADNIIRAYFHRIPIVFPSGKMWNEDVFCKREEGIECEFCKRVDEQERKAGLKLCSWVYAYEIQHKFQNPRLQKEEDAEVWKKNKSGMYVENINKAMFWLSGVGKDKVLLKMLANLNAKYGTLLDREYEITRSGFDKGTTYTIIPESPSAIPENIKHLNLPDLLKVVKGEILSLNPDEKPVLTSKEKEEAEEIPIARKVFKKPAAKKTKVEEEEVRHDADKLF